jgi:hypothetical protein
MTVQIRIFCLASLAAFTWGAGMLQAQETSGHVDGLGQIWVPTSEQHPAGIKLFEPTHVYATRSTRPKRVWLLITDQDASGVEWRRDVGRIDVLRAWCKAEAASFVLFEFRDSGVAEGVQECGGSGAIRSQLVSVTNGLPSVSPTFEVFDGERIRGRIVTGEGWCGEQTYCTRTRDFRVDVEVRP